MLPRLVVFCVALVALFASTRLMFYMWTDAGFWATASLRIFLVLLLLFLAATLFSRLIINAGHRSDLAKNAWTVLLSVFCMFLLLEAGFMFVPRSHATGSLASRVWNAYYWKPVNSLGFRDREIASGSTTGYRVLVVGDSFTEGYGIKNVEDRYSDVLAKRLGDGFRVYNVGRSGFDTKMEYQLMLNYPVRPSFVILQYFGNDIERVCARPGREFPGFQPYSELPFGLHALVANSFLLNYVYWNAPRGGTLPMGAANSRYADWMTSCYKDPIALERHLADLSRFIEYSRDNDCPLLVVIFPFLAEQVGSINTFVPLIEAFLAERNIPFVSVESIAKDLSPEERVVSPSDSHASVKLNHLIALAIVPAMERARISFKANTSSRAASPTPARADGYEATLAEGIQFERAGYPRFVTAVKGMSDAEKFGRWTEGARVGFAFSEPLPKAFVLKLEIVTAFGPNAGEPVKIRVGDWQGQAIVGSTPQTIELQVATPVAANSIELVIAKPTSPMTLGISRDARLLGIALKRLSISPL